MFKMYKKIKHKYLVWKITKMIAKDMKKPRRYTY